MNRSAPISGFERPSRASRATFASWSVSAARAARRADSLTGRHQLLFGARSERLDAHPGQHPRAPRAAAHAPRDAVLGAQPLAVVQLRAREVGPESRPSRAARSLRGEAAQRPRPRTAARANAPRCRAPNRRRWLCVATDSRENAAAARSRSAASACGADQLDQPPVAEPEIARILESPARPPPAPRHSVRGRYRAPRTPSR